MTLLFVVVMGIVEGLTEYLPISSTGHLILVSHWFEVTGKKVNAFNIFIQLGAILAVVWEYRDDLRKLAQRVFVERAARLFVAKLFVAFLPAAIVGFLFHDRIEERLFFPVPVAAALIVGGMLIFTIEQALPHR